MFLKDLLFPKVCLSCGFLGSYICIACQNKLKSLKYDTCLYCQRRAYAGLTHPGCIRNFGIDGCLSIFYYNNELKRIIKNIKYRFVKEGLSEFLAAIEPQVSLKILFYKQLVQPLHIQPIPLHIQRFKQRGFNQAEHIANFFSVMMEVPMVNTLTRKKDTYSQARLPDRKKRYENMQGAFELTAYSSIYKNILLVDDVVTTGSTMKEAAKTLKRNGIEKVFVLAIAKG